MGDDEMAAPRDANGPDRLIAGRYRLSVPIGKGGMGEVWQAYDESLDRRVAVKMMLAEQPHPYAIQGDAHREALEIRRQRFLREVRTAAGLHEHPGIPAVHDTGYDASSGRLYVVMQFLEGREVQTLIDEAVYEEEQLPLAWAAAIGAQIASALDLVHRHNVVHRDIKPANLMITPGGVVKVLDFGVAALLGAGSNPHLTQEGMTVGTPAYMSPEQSLANAVGPAADIYALACVIYQLLTGTTPFPEADGKSSAWHHVHTSPPSVRAKRPDVPEVVDGLLRGMLHKDSERRMSAATVYETLLPLAERGAPVGTAPLLTADGLEIDPCTPFTRPFGDTLRRGHARAMAYTPTGQSAPVARDSGHLPLSEAETDEVVDRAGQLAKQKRFTQAVDVLTTALARADDEALVIDLTLPLAHVRFLAGAHSEALKLFQQVAEGLARRLGAEDVEVWRCLYYVAQCRMELGETTAAVGAFSAYVQQPPDQRDEEAVDRHLEALAQIMRLEAGSERFAKARAAAVTLRAATRRYRGSSAGELADIDGFIERLRRFE